MSRVIQLPEEIEGRLRRWAELAHQSEEDVICRALDRYLAIPPDLREELEAWQQLGAEAIEKVAPGAIET